MSAPSNDAALAALVEEIVRQVIAQLKGEGLPGLRRAKPLLFVLDGSAIGLEPATNLLRSAAARGPVEVFATPAFRGRHGVEAPTPLPEGTTVRMGMSPSDFPTLFEGTPAFCFLLPRRVTLAKAARGLADDTTSLLLQEALMHGKPVFCAGGDFHPDAWPAIAPPLMKRGEGSLGAQAERDLSTLQGWGLNYRREPAELLGLLLDAWKLPPELAKRAPAANAGVADSLVKTLSGFVTVSDLRSLHAQGVRHLRLAPGVRMTDAALEEIVTLSMTLEEG